MGLFVTGLLVGVGFGVFLLALGWRHLPATRGTLTRLLGHSVAQQVAVEAVRDVEKNDRELAGILATEPAVPLDSVPPEVTAEAQQLISAAASEEAAVEAAKKFIRDDDLARVIATLVRWRTRRTNSEQTFQNSFRSFAMKNGYSQSLTERPRISWGKQEARVAIPDLVMNERVLVELKAQMDGSGQADRAMGQMLRYLFAWKRRGPAVLAVCGNVSPEFRFIIRMYIDTWRQKLNLPVIVFFKQGDTDANEPALTEVPSEAHVFPEQ